MLSMRILSLKLKFVKSYCNMKILKYIILLLAALACVSCDLDEHIDMNTMVVIGEKEYKNNGIHDTSLFIITYESLNYNNGLDIYVITNKDAFEVGDRVKLVKADK